METRKIVIDLKEYNDLIRFVENFKSEKPLILCLYDEFGDFEYITTDEAVKTLLEQNDQLKKQGVELLNKIRELNLLIKRNWIQRLFG